MPDTSISPSRDASQSTARSRVLAMLGKMDSNAEADAQNNVVDQISASSAPSSQLSTSKPEFESPGLSMSSSDVDEREDDVIVRPRGRLAARMIAEETTSEAQNQETESARERVKKLLLASTTEDKEPLLDERKPDGDEESDIAVSSKRHRFSSRHATPRPLIAEPDHSTTGSMFVSPASNRSASPGKEGPGSENELPAIPQKDSRFLELVAKKREERLAREAEKDRMRAEKRALQEALERNMQQQREGSDEDVERQLTQQVRPTRKASKRAIEEMQRETQRMSRNMQLAHQAKTKKKITKSSLFAKFNYKPGGISDAEGEDQTRPATSSSAPQSEAEKEDTPPTSPMSHAENVDKFHEPTENINAAYSDDEGLPDLADVLQSEPHIPSSPPAPSRKVDKGKGKAVEQVNLLLEDNTSKPKTFFTQRPIRVKPPKVLAPVSNEGDDSDSDLEIVPAETTVSKVLDSKMSIFDRVPAKQSKESHSLQALRMLAHLTSPGRKGAARNKKPSMSATELQMSLQQRARQQAARERQEREQALREKGVVILTNEEKEKEMAYVEDMITKARREADEIAKDEKDAAKRERKANGEVDPLGDSSDDEDWEEEKEIFAEELAGSGLEDEDEDVDDADISDEGSEEEEDYDENNENAMEEAETEPANELIDNEASESDTEEENNIVPSDEDDAAFIDNGDDVEDEDRDDKGEDIAEVPIVASRRRTKHLNVISDDEDDDAPVEGHLILHTDSPQPRSTDSPMAPPSVLRSATKTFIPGLTVAGPAGLGLTQIFAGTMDDNQTQFLNASPSQMVTTNHQKDAEHDPLAFLRNLPAPKMPDFQPTIDDDSQDIVRDSQTGDTQVAESQPQDSVSTQAIQLNFSQSQIHGFDSLPHDTSGTQFSDFPELTQDGGFQVMSPIMGRFVEPPPSTVGTVILDPSQKPGLVEESPVMKRKGKLRRRTEIPILSDDEEEEQHHDPSVKDNGMELSANIFDVMRTAATKKKQLVIDEFNKKKSGAKEMVEEQAQESEDEYAGLGGASDDESEGEEDALIRAMIDDETSKDADESKLAAFYADEERANDEKQVEKLFKDITSGMLRRKRGADYDLSDSDDGGEARRRRKRREFAKMRKALLEDERIGKIAENPKKLAFLRAIEDRGDEEEIDFLEDYADSNEGIDSQSQSQTEDSQKETTHIPDSQPYTVMGPPKRKLPSDVNPEKRPPPYMRRTQTDKKPSNLSEIRQSLSSLIEEPNAILVTHDSSESEEEDRDDNGDDDGSDLVVDERRKSKGKENRDPFARRTANIPVVDRISLKRATSNTTSSNTKLAFASTSASVGSFKVPPLLRRATTNSSVSSTSGSSSISGTERGASGEKGFVKKGAGRNSGVHYFAKERERMEKVVEGEKRREEKRFQRAAGRREVVGELFGMGKFE